MTLLLIQQNQNEDVQQLKECAKEQFHQLNITAYIYKDKIIIQSSCLNHMLKEELMDKPAMEGLEDLEPTPATPELRTWTWTVFAGAWATM